MKPIDKAAVVAEIERRVEAIRKAFNEPGILSGVDRTYAYAQYEAFKSLFPYLDALETKEVDLKKELDYDDYIAFFKEHPEYNNGDWGFDECWVFAKYFFELGLKAQKGE